MPANPLETLTSPIKLVEATPELVKAVQQLLGVAADGIPGPKTLEAFRRFKQQYFLSDPDWLGSTTAKKLLELSFNFQKGINRDLTLASRIIRYCLAQNYSIAVGERLYNIVYVEGINVDGSSNNDRLNEWNDRRIVIEIVGGKPKIVGNWVATSEPGAKYTYSPLNPEGAARIAFGQYTSWRVGIHKDHEALVQVADIKIHRDRNKDGSRAGDPVRIGCYGINQHWGYDMAHVNGASAGCLVGQSRNGHREFMRIIKQDKRACADKNYIFLTAVISGDDLIKQFPA